MGFGLDVGSLVGGVASAWSADKANKRNIAWEREKAQNYHQWEVKDLQAAGLNPILSADSHATLGGANQQGVDYSFLGTARAQKLANEAQKANTAKTVQETATGKAQESLIQEEEKNTAEQTRAAKAQADLLEAQANAETPRIKNKQNYNKSDIGQGMGYIKYFTEDAQEAILTALEIGGIAKMGKSMINSAAKAKNEKFLKSLLDDKRAGQIRLPQINM